MRIDFDSAWKDALEAYFAPFLMVAAPELAPLMGDHEAPVFLDQELQELARALGDEPDPENTDESVAADAGAEYGAGRRGRTTGRAGERTTDRATGRALGGTRRRGDAVDRHGTG